MSNVGMRIGTFYLPGGPGARSRVRLSARWLERFEWPRAHRSRYPEGSVYRLWLGRLFVSVMVDPEPARPERSVREWQQILATIEDTDE